MMLTDLQVFIDGSDGGMWAPDLDAEWPRILSGQSDPNYRFLRVSDVIELLKSYESTQNT